MCADRELDFQTLFEKAPGTYLILSPDLTMIAASDAYFEATNTRRELIIGRHVFDVFPDNPNDPNATGEHNLATSFRRVLDDRAADTMAVQKYDVQKSDGSGFEERYWSLVNSPILGEDGSVVCIVNRVEDVTEFVQLRQAGSDHERLTQDLRDRAERMQAEILTRSRDLQLANEHLRVVADELKRAEAVRGRFLAMTSHELRTPLTAIGGFTRTMIDMWDEGLRDSQKLEFLQIIDSQVERLSRLVQDLLLLAEIESGKLASAPGPTQVSNVIKQTVRGLTSELHIDVACTDDLVAMADAERLEQILANFISNARKYGETPIAVEARRADDWVEIRVSDSGPGVPADFVPQLFTEFARQDAHRSDHSIDGTGLGLSIVRRLARAQGGDAFYEDAAPHGACFGVRLPARAS